MDRMSIGDIESVLAECERQIAAGTPVDLRASGFWRVVRAAKQDAAIAHAYADRLGDIDTAVFARWARLIIPVWLGTSSALGATLCGCAIMIAATQMTQWAGVVFLAGAGAVIGATHGLGHLIVGRLSGIRFSAWFVGRGRPQPGVKTEYGSYLRATPRARAWMHAAGAVVTKIVPFLALPIAIASDAVPSWVSAVLLLLGAAQIVTDVLWSTKSSDWAKFSREMRYAR